MPLDSASRKIIRVYKQSEAVEKCLAAYRASNPCEVVTNADGKKELRITSHPPPDISLLCGEMIYQMRSALDHAFFEFIGHKWTIPDELVEVICFPLICDRDATMVGPTPRDKFNLRKTIRDQLSDDAFALIERVQPYHRRGEHANDLLRILAKLSNIDKHRRLNLTVARVTTDETVTNAKGWSSALIQPLLDDGAPIYSGHHPPEIYSAGEVKVERQLTPVVAFNEPDTAPDTLVLVETVIYDLPNAVGWVLAHIHRLF